MNIRFLDVAAQEMNDAFVYYEEQQYGLGHRFVNNVIHALNSLAAFPEAWHPLSARTRRCQLRKFPYGLIYQIRENEILVVAVAHLHRHPGYWKDRIT